MRHMKTIPLTELHARTGAWVRKAVELRSIVVTERGKPLVRLEAVVDVNPTNPFRVRRLRPGYVRLRGSSAAALTARPSSLRIASGRRPRELFRDAGVFREVMAQVAGLRPHVLRRRLAGAGRRLGLGRSAGGGGWLAIGVRRAT